MSLCKQDENTLREMLSGKANPSFEQNFFVEAGAGAGKTTVIVDRLISLMTKGKVPPENLVAITFTIKSTRELQERLDHKLLALCQAEPENQELVALRKKLVHVKISTIHDFCRKMIQTMPFHGGIGSAPLEEILDDSGEIIGFLKTSMRQDPQRFSNLEALSLNAYKLKEHFLFLCQHQEDGVAFHPVNSSEMVTLKKTLLTQGKTIQQELRNLFYFCGKPLDPSEAEKFLEPVMIAFLEDQPEDDEILAGLSYLHLNAPPIRFRGKEVEALKKTMKSTSEKTKKTYAEANPIYDILEKVEAYANQSDFSAMQEAMNEYLHSQIMTHLVPLREDYIQYKKEKRYLSTDDLLIFARDLLKNNPEAREYFHQLYQVIFVDEFQDTDPIQTEILFYLTAELKTEEMLPKQWDDCKPKGGSLFLVGDPKQGIYRFRGADISNYNKVQELFVQSPNSEVVVLRNNYRSGRDILDFVDCVFNPEPTTAATLNQSVDFSESTTMEASPYQATYEKMNPGRSEAGLVEYYIPEGDEPKDLKKNDPDTVAQLVNSMMVKARERGETLNYEDFLILTRTKSAVNTYVQALTGAGIPSVSSGEREFGKIKPIQMGLQHLYLLAYPNDHVALSQLLFTQYKISLQTQRRFLYFAETNLYRGISQEFTVKKVLSCLSDSEEDHEVAKLCGLSKIFEVLIEKGKSNPPMSVIEWIFDGTCALSYSKQEQEAQEEFAMVQLFLNEIRNHGQGNLMEYYEFAVQYAKKTIESQLQLEEFSNSVRVMNLHKAKGLEGKVVILTYHKTAEHFVSSHIERSPTGNTIYYASDFSTPPLWIHPAPGKIVTETKFEDGEKVRLAYVAITRAKNNLILAGGKSSVWTGLVNKLDQSHRIDLAQLEPIPQVVAAKSMVCDINPFQGESLLVQRGEDVRQSNYSSISPSKLDHRAPRTRKKEEEGPAEEAESVLDKMKDEVATSQLQIEPESHQAYGPDWGTIVHRVMELVVEENRYSEDCLKTFALQAILEVFPTNLLTLGQSRLLFGETGVELQEEQRTHLAVQVVNALCFLQNEKHEFWNMLKQGTHYPELSFFTSVRKEEKPELHQHLCEHLGGGEGEEEKEQEEEQEKTEIFDVQGYIDLAVKTSEGWIVIDYKTDRVRTGESEVDYDDRLKDHYVNQIRAYGLLLFQATNLPVLGSYLCSIPLGGKIIDLDISILKKI